MLVAERWILAALLKWILSSITEVNQAIRELLGELNHRKFHKLGATRARLSEEVHRLALKPLPERPYPFRTWKKAHVHSDYHVEIDHHY